MDYIGMIWITDRNNFLLLFVIAVDMMCLFLNDNSIWNCGIRCLNLFLWSPENSESMKIAELLATDKTNTMIQCFFQTKSWNWTFLANPAIDMSIYELYEMSLSNPFDNGHDLVDLQSTKQAFERWIRPWSQLPASDRQRHAARWHIDSKRTLGQPQGFPFVSDLVLIILICFIIWDAFGA